MGGLQGLAGEERSAHIIEVLLDAFADLIEAGPPAFRRKFRKMAADPFAFYRGSACLFYADVARLDDPWADEQTSRVWIQGDLHAENFGTQHALQARADPWLGWCELAGRGQLVQELSPYESDLDWDSVTDRGDGPAPQVPRTGNRQGPLRLGRRERAGTTAPGGQ